MMCLLFSLCIVGRPLIAKAPQFLDWEIITPNSEYNESLIKTKYPELFRLLKCMVFHESSYSKRLKGDGGLAYGPYQIHIDKHPVTENCAMDFECSLDYTAKLIKSGQGYLWTSFAKCT